MSYQTVNVALLGYGYSEKTFHCPLIAQVAGLRLTHIVSSDRKKVLTDWPDVTVLASAEEAFANPDVNLVVIATPNDTHFHLAARALSAGKSVVVDKPFTTTIAEASELARMATNLGRMISVFQNRRWDSDFLTVRHVLAEGRIGEVAHFESHFDRYRPQVQARWRERRGQGSGVWYDLGPHLVDQVLQIFGRPATIYADFEAQRKGAETVDYFHVIMRYGRTRVILHAASFVAAKTARFTIHGHLGSFVKYGIDTQEDALRRGQTPGTPSWGCDPELGSLVIPEHDSMRSTLVPNIPGNYLLYYEAIRDSILRGAPNPVPPLEAVGVMTMLEVASESARTGQELPLPHPTRHDTGA
ncbi:MAG TPA: oxidoreductase [Bryobacteraceae bacterium]|jgi:predicted dehydrogenase|nr:oxidoreductase [Bryobacteraceae bacterium]